MKKSVLLPMKILIGIIGILWGSCTNELLIPETSKLDTLRFKRDSVNVDTVGQGPGFEEQDSIPENVAKECHEMFLKDYATFPVAMGYGNKQNKPETQGIIINELSQITTTQFFATFIMRGQNDLNFTSTDEAVDYATSHGKQIHGHCLIYGMSEVNPGWLRTFSGNNQQFEDQVRNFIDTTLKRYRGRVRGYDVANELFSYNNSSIDNTWIRNRFSSDSEYIDFIARCFQYAHAADPDAVLFYNDYGQEYRNNNYEKARAIVNLVNNWKNQGVPVHGFGLQVHTNIYRPIADIEKALELAVSTGLQVHISELDVSINNADWDISGVQGGVQGLTYADDVSKQKQKEMYRKVVDAYKRIVPPAQQYGITLWDLCDKYSWLNWNRFEAGTLYDENYQRKPAFYGFIEGLSGELNDCD